MQGTCHTYKGTYIIAWPRSGIWPECIKLKIVIIINVSIRTLTDTFSLYCVPNRYIHEYYCYDSDVCIRCITVSLYA